jgi:predicted acyltransferase
MTAASTPLGDYNPTYTYAKPARMLSLDLLRGLTIGFMILVNNNGDGLRAYWPLKHSVWNGFTPTDLVFPTFLFLVGISTVLSTASRVAKGASRKSLFFHVLRRAIILYLLGIVVNSFPFFNLHTMRFYGVLPRIAICYFVVATLYLINSGWRSKVVLAIVALVGYWALMRFVPVPGFGTPTHEVRLLDPDANLTAWLDRLIFSAPHLYEKTRDPEGLLSTLPALATTLMGLLTGYWLRTSHTLVYKVRGIAFAGLSCLLLGWLWNLSFPINKKLWTSSFVLFAGGLSLLLLALFIWIADMRATSQDKPTRIGNSWYSSLLLVFGTNAITAYVLSELLASAFSSIHFSSGFNVEQWLYRSILAAVPDPALASLLYSLAFVAVCWLVVYMMLYRRRIFIKI